MQEKAIAATVNSLIQDPVKGTTAVLLEGIGQRTILPIWIGLPEALAISHALSGTPAARPLTHTLLLHTISALDGKMQKIEITRIEDETFFALLHVKVGRHTIAIDARPSDAIAIAVHGKVPIIVAENVWAAAGIPLTALGVQHSVSSRRLRPQNELKVKLKRLRDKESRV